MSDPTPIGPAPAPRQADVQSAIARAAQATGADFEYLLGQARIESSLDPQARAGTSSAAGLYQFTQGTWLATLDRHGTRHGYGWASAAIENGRVRDPAMRDQIMAMRHDPSAAALMAGELANDNAAALAGVLGRAPDPAELYLAHFLGADGARRFLAALAADPTQSAAALFPQAAAANRAIFHEPDGAPRSLSGVMDLIRGKMAAAMGEGAPTFQPGMQMARAAEGFAIPERPAPTRPSMAETVASAFGGNLAAAPDHVRQAYGKFRSFGL